jgi:hypothetical protein
VCQEARYFLVASLTPSAPSRCATTTLNGTVQEWCSQRFTTKCRQQQQQQQLVQRDEARQLQMPSSAASPAGNTGMTAVWSALLQPMTRTHNDHRLRHWCRTRAHTRTLIDQGDSRCSCTTVWPALTMHDQRDSHCARRHRYYTRVLQTKPSSG